MGTAALVLGIISFVISLIPFVRILAGITAIISIILGIVELTKKTNEKKKSESIVGIVLSSIAVVFLIINIIIFTFLGIIFSGKIINEIIDNMDKNAIHIYDELDDNINIDFNIDKDTIHKFLPKEDHINIEFQDTI